MLIYSDATTLILSVRQHAGRRYLVRMVATRGNRLRTISVAAGNVGDDGTLADVVAILKGEWEDR